MKTIIENKIYDTDTAVDIACIYVNSNKYEVLYVTKNGNWFLYKEFNSGFSKDIKPMSADETLAWLIKYDCIEEIDYYFGDIVVEA